MRGTKILWEDGIVIRDGDASICFDPQTRLVTSDAIFISHAHGDHTTGFTDRNTLKICHPATMAIYEAVSGRTPPKVQCLNYGESTQIDDFRVSMHNSGHIPGSTLFEVEGSEESIVYTGDLNCIDTVLTKAADRVQCDTLIIESTYGRPDFVFPLRHEVYKNVVEWVIGQVRKGKTPAFYVYAVGKAQEIIKALNDFT
ncbi:MAG: MBL fold metallo-hydrolase, partial [Candidatus Bathyarchaeia archaeon]